MFIENQKTIKYSIHQMRSYVRRIFTGNPVLKSEPIGLIKRLVSPICIIIRSFFSLFHCRFSSHFHAAFLLFRMHL